MLSKPNAKTGLSATAWHSLPDLNMVDTTEIHRLPGGAIDTAYYQRRGDKLRSAAAYAGFKKITRRLAPPRWLQDLGGSRDKAVRQPVHS